MVRIATRRERVVLELEDQLSTGMLKAAAATALLDKELNGLSGDAVRSSKATRDIDREMGNLGKTARSTEKDIDKLSGRIGILAEAAAFIAPSFAPIGAVAVPAITGLASSLGFAALGAGVAVAAFQGVGDALKAVNKAALEPTATNLAAAKLAMQEISPAARGFVRELSRIQPELLKMRDLAASGLFPGLTEGLDGLLKAGPRVEAIVTSISTALGDIAGDAGESLGSERWAPFLDFLAKEGPAALADLSAAIGNTAHALANLWIAFTPLNTGFSQWLVDATQDLDNWSAGLSKTEGFQEFIDYIETNGPRVAETFGAIGNAVLQIVEAIAPLGGPSLAIIEALADAIASIADSPLGTPLLGLVAALGALSTGARAYAAVSKATFGGPGAAMLRNYSTGLFNVATAQQRATLSAKELAAIQAGTARSFGRVAIGAAGLTLALTGVADKAGLANTATLSLLGPWGTAGGLLLDLKARGDSWAESINGIYAAANSGDIDQLNASLSQTKSQLDDLQNQDGVGDFFGDLFTNIAGSDLLGLGKSAIDKAKDAIAYGEAYKPVIAAIDSLSQNAAVASGFLATGLDGVAAATNAATAAQAARILSMQEAKKATGDAFDAETNYRQALKDAQEQAAKNNAGIRGSSDAALENRRQLTNLKNAWNGQTDAVKNNEGRYKSARKSFIDTAVAMGVPIKKARELANSLLEIPKSKVIPVKVTGVAKALADIRTVQNALNALNASRGISLSNQGVKNDPNNRASGGPIYGPGTPTSDSIPAMLSNGEYVIRAAAVARYGTGFFDQANQMRLAAGGPAAYTNSLQPAQARPLTLADYLHNDLDLKFPQTLKQWNKALAESTKVVDKEKDQRQKLLDQANSVKDAITNGYKSALFGQTSDTELPDWLSPEQKKAFQPSASSTLQGDIGNLGALNAAIKVLTSKGLDGPALADLLSNASLSEVQSYAGQSSADLAKYEQQYNQRERLLGTSGNLAASASFGAQIAIANRQLAVTNRMHALLTSIDKWAQKNPHATGQEVAKAINGAVTKGGRH